MDWGPETLGLTGLLPDRVVLWQRRTGRHVALPPQALEDPSAALLARLHGLHLLGPPPDPARLIPARSAWTLLLPEAPALWRPLPLQRGPGGVPFAAMPLDEAEVAIWRACNGSRTVARVAEQLALPVEALLFFFAKLTDPACQALQLLDRPARAREPGLERLLLPPRPPNVRDADQYGASGETTLQDYHQHGIVDGSTHFDDRETTLAHAFAIPHPALRGEPYGARLGARLAQEGLLPGDGGVILEIGPGTGELCAALRRALRRPHGYLRLDLSPALLETQAARNPETRSVEGSATDIPLPDASVDLVIANEMIADLEAAPDPGRWGEALIPEPGQRLFNTGAFAMVEELHRVLRPGGAAFITEFGGLDEVPVETTQLDHPEVSVHFGQLARVAAAAGFEAELSPLGPWMGFDAHTRWLSRASYEALRARFRAEGRSLQARAWTPETLRTPWPVEGLRFVPITEDGPGPVVTRFWALVLRR
ncbi:MAG: class I SAM-dependent methyltransferase [Alphaproteobacteria bacterium]|nr:class I SAM-dependent methyltransferase [Alphaproteobacteria bacterium]